MNTEQSEFEVARSRALQKPTTQLRDWAARAGTHGLERGDAAVVPMMKPNENPPQCPAVIAPSLPPISGTVAGSMSPQMLAPFSNVATSELLPAVDLVKNEEAKVVISGSSLADAIKLLDAQEVELERLLDANLEERRIMKVMRDENRTLRAALTKDR